MNGSDLFIAGAVFVFVLILLYGIDRNGGNGGSMPIEDAFA